MSVGYVSFVRSSGFTALLVLLSLSGLTGLLVPLSLSGLTSLAGLTGLSGLTDLTGLTGLTGHGIDGFDRLCQFNHLSTLSDLDDPTVSSKYISQGRQDWGILYSLG